MKKPVQILILITLLGLTLAGTAYAQSPTPTPRAATPAGPVGTPTPTIPPPPTPIPCPMATADTPAVKDAFEQRLVELINAQRFEEKMPPLKRITDLTRSSRFHASDMAKKSYYQYDSYDVVNGKQQKVCEWAGRIKNYYPGMVGVVEVLTLGQKSPAEALDAWYNRSMEMSALMSGFIWEIGVGYVESAKEPKTFWVADLGRRIGSYPVIINYEAAVTSSPNVTLYAYGEWKEMRLRNDKGTWSKWMPFKNTVSWTLPSKLGEHTVEVELKDEVATVSSSDSINLIKGKRSLVPLVIRKNNSK